MWHHSRFGGNKDTVEDDRTSSVKRMKNVLTWRRLSPSGRSRTRCWRQSEAWWAYFSLTAACRPPLRPAICCAAKTEAQTENVSQNTLLIHCLQLIICNLQHTVHQIWEVCNEILIRWHFINLLFCFIFICCDTWRSNTNALKNTSRKTLILIQIKKIFFFKGEEKLIRFYLLLSCSRN